MEATICARDRSSFLQRLAQVWKWRRVWPIVLVPLSRSGRFFNHNLSECEESQATEILFEMILASTPFEYRGDELGSVQNARQAKFFSAMHCEERPICVKKPRWRERWWTPQELQYAADATVKKDFDEGVGTVHCCLFYKNNVFHVAMFLSFPSVGSRSLNLCSFSFVSA